MDNKELNELNPDELDQVAGGRYRVKHKNPFGCPHTNKVRTGNQQEEPVFYFWSKRQYEYTCPDCGKIWYISEGKE